MDFWSCYGWIFSECVAMVKIMASMLVILALWGVYQNSRINILKKNNDVLQAQNKALILNNERLVKNEVELRKQKAEIKKTVQSEKLNFNWGYNLADSVVRKRVSDNCLSCKR